MNLWGQPAPDWPVSTLYPRGRDDDYCDDDTASLDDCEGFEFGICGAVRVGGIRIVSQEVRTAVRAALFGAGVLLIG